MPRSKRNKQIELAKTKKRGLEWKKRLFEEIRSCVDKYANVFVFSVSDMRNSKMKNVREQWKHSRFFIGKNKIMAMALGRFDEEEYKPNLHKLGQQIKGQRGLLFSNKSIEEVLSWFRSYSEGDYARSGNIATETVNLPAGPLTMFPHNQEPYLRQLGLPTSLVKGVIHLVKDHEVCKVGDVLTPETAKILKLLQYEMAEFHITIDCVWSQDGSFMQLTESVDSGAKENSKKGKKTLLGSKTTEIKSDTLNMEEMDVELKTEKSDSDDSDSSEDVKIKSDSLNMEEMEVELKIEESDSDSCEDENNNSSDKCTKTSTHNAGFQSFHDSSTRELESSEKSIIEDKVDETACLRNEKVTDGNGVDVDESSCLTDDKLADNKETTSGTVGSKISETLFVNNNKSVDINENTPNTGKGFSKRKSVKNKVKKVSLSKTPDANTSQDSPVFRQLRNRSVKVSTKKK